MLHKTPDHPHDYLERRPTIETDLPIRIGDDCWLGGGELGVESV